jgi:hypothetical protein
VVWVGRVNDSKWVHRLIEADVSFLLPAPRGYSSEAVNRFSEGVALVLDRQFRLRQMLAEPAYPEAVCELVDTLLHGADPDQAVGSLLQLAADDFRRGAVFLIEETAFRCRAGFGYPLDRNVTALPRGVGLLERTLRTGDPLVGVDPESGGARQLSRVLGIDSLVPQTAVIPLGTGASIGGLLVADREGETLSDLRDMAVLARWLGGIVMRMDARTSANLTTD